MTRCRATFVEASSNDNVSDLEDCPRIESHDLEPQPRPEWLGAFHAAVEEVVVEGKTARLQGSELEPDPASQEEARRWASKAPIEVSSRRPFASVP